MGSILEDLLHMDFPPDIPSGCRMLWVTSANTTPSIPAIVVPYIPTPCTECEM